MDYKNLILKIFKQLVDIAYAKDEKGVQFKLKEYTHTIKAITDYDGCISSIDTVKQILIQSGKKNPKSTLIKIEEIMNTGTLAYYEKEKDNPIVQAVGNFSKIYAFGPKKSKDLYTLFKITNIPELHQLIKNNNNKYEGKSILNKKQLIGLQYHEDLQKRIPYQEMLKYQTFLSHHLDVFNKKNNTCMKLSINGSFRRKCSDSGDIDVLITEKGDIIHRKEWISYLQNIGFIKEILADGNNKFMGICKLTESSITRHIDIIETKSHHYPFGILYFTGSGGFNTYMRTLSLQKGYSLNEYEFSDKKTKVPISSQEIRKKIQKDTFETEQDIFTFLDIDYVLPENRNKITISKIN